MPKFHKKIGIPISNSIKPIKKKSTEKPKLSQEQISELLRIKSLINELLEENNFSDEKQKDDVFDMDCFMDIVDSNSYQLPAPQRATKLENEGEGIWNGIKKEYF